MERVILSAGGTGGHIFPALAVAEQIRLSHPGAEILFVGSKDGPEAVFAARSGLAFKGLAVRGFLGRGFKAVFAAFAMLRAVVDARRLIAAFKPDIVVGFGGYASFAPVIAARSLGLPCVVHEQNALGGFSNKLLGRLVDKVFVSMPETAGFEGLDCAFTGNPVRLEVSGAGRWAGHSAASRRLLVFGGSQGARTLNNFMMNALPALREHGIEIMLQTGEFDYERVINNFQAIGDDKAIVMPFIENMAEAYAWSDLVLCRSGATTVAELAAAGKPSILIPFPYATHDHQTCNAKAMEKRGASLLMTDEQLRKSDAVKAIVMLFENRDKLRAMGRAAFEAARPEAALNVVKAMQEVIRKKNARQN